MGLPIEADTQLFDRDMLEGNYTTYTHLWTNAVTDGLWVSRISLHIDTLRNLYYQEWLDLASWKRFGVYTLDTGAVIFENPAGTDYLWVAPITGHDAFIGHSVVANRASSHARYVVIQRTDGFTLEVWKDGAMLWTIDIRVPDPACGWINQMIMSQDGRWLLVITNVGNIVCFRGD